ncbi:MAG TPA: hypothetical protein V6C89_15235 [Drouetiella sp.]
MSEVTEKTVADFVETAKTLRALHALARKHSSITHELQGNLREDGFERRVRESACDLKVLADTVCRQDGQRCVYMSNALVSSAYNRQLRQAHDKLQRLLDQIAASIGDYSSQQVSVVAREMMDLERMLEPDRWPKLGDERTLHFSDSITDAYKRVVKGDFSGFAEKIGSHDGVQLMRLAPDEHYPNSARSQLAAAVNKLIDIWEPEEFPGDASPAEIGFMPPWMMMPRWFYPPWTRGWGPHSITRQIERHRSAHDYRDPKIGDKLARALLAKDDNLVDNLNYEQAVTLAGHQLDAEALGERLSAVRAQAEVVRDLLQKLKGSIDQHNSDWQPRLSFVIGSLLLHQVWKSTQGLNLPKGPSMVLSGSYEAKQADPCRLVVSLIAERNKNRRR